MCPGHFGIEGPKYCNDLLLPGHATQLYSHEYVIRLTMYSLHSMQNYLCAKREVPG